MSSETANKPALHKFFVYAPDLPGPETPKRRVAHLPEHFKTALPLIKSGFIVYGGGVLTPESVSMPGAEEIMIGSFLICAGESLEAVLETLKKDVFYHSGEVWDVEKLVILPAKVADSFN
ncbi:uncharacterized protein FIBRA_08111 [Fibroporia radiculosa]|uniref:YCII-related domain-containing protein n=1 Tax=Fibroporia radiculosa TaxID=599839 RepID=J4H500_9APHY|nr:uncharacterized protein FIBRA_08111 [Fibroporia radiculosa]CCM05874.1 predicted protein [Fibroporia radiculosa]